MNDVTKNNSGYFPYLVSISHYFVVTNIKINKTFRVQRGLSIIASAEVWLDLLSCAASLPYIFMYLSLITLIGPDMLAISYVSLYMKLEASC